MSRIYDDKPLANLPLVTVDHAKWNQELMTDSGDGVLIEGNVTKRSHVSVNTDNGMKIRYYILHVEVQRAHRRKFDGSGREVTPNFSETQKVRTGFLNNYKVEAKGQTDRIDNQEVKKLLQHPTIEQIYRKSPSLVSNESLSLWLPESQTEKMEISDNDSLRITTKRNSPFIENLTKIEIATPAVSNFAGEQVGGNWTDKIMSMKSNTKETSSADNDDADWDD